MNTNMIELATANKELSVSVDLEPTPVTVHDLGAAKINSVYLKVKIHTPGDDTESFSYIATDILYVEDENQKVHPVVDLINRALAEYASFCNTSSWLKRMVTNKYAHCLELRSCILTRIARTTDNVAQTLKFHKPGYVKVEQHSCPEQENLLA